MTSRVPILLYHDIVPETQPVEARGLGVSIDRFRDDMERLRARGWRCVSAFEAAELALTGRRAARTFALTFDDGLRDFAELAHPVLKRLGFTATVFVVAGRIGGRADWGSAGGKPLLDADEIRMLAREGVEFGSHGCTHVRLPACSERELFDELRGSRATLADLIGRDVTSIAWPYGANDGRTRRAAREAGYRVGFGVAGGGPLLRRAWTALRPARRDRFAVPRREVRGGDSRLRRRLRMGPADGLLVAARKLGAIYGTRS